MLNPDRFPGRLYRPWQPSLRTMSASAGVLMVALAIGVSVYHAPYAAASDSEPLAANVVRSATDFNWRQSPSWVLTSPGRNSVILAPCPPGVIAAEPWYYVYISGTGTPEAVRVTGGTCKGDGRPGTLEFTTTNPHPSGYAMSSASGGIQEATIEARFIPSNLKASPQSGKVVIPPGEYDIFAPISIRASNQTIDFAGSLLNCYTPNDPCIFVGDPVNSNAFESITLNGPRGRPMMVAGTKPFIEVNGQQTRIFNVAAGWPPHGASFGAYVQVDDDQAFLLDGLDTVLGGSALTCNPTYCGAFVMAPGPFNKWSAVGWLKHLNLSLQCAGKGVEWISGNSLKISDSVIQGWSVFGVRVSNHRGGYAGLMTDNVYFEASPACRQYSPFGNVGSAAVIAEGIQVKINGLGANSPTGVYPNWGGESGGHDWLYWVVPVHAKFGEGIPLPAGHAVTNGSGSIMGTFPKIGGASSYKILKMDWDRGTIPRPYQQGTGNYLLTTILQGSCATLTCQFTDNGGALSSYTNAGENLSASVYMPRLDFWPGAIVLSPAEDMSTASYSTPVLPLQADALGIGGIVTTLPSWAVAAEANTVMGSPATPPAAANIEAMHTNGVGPLPGATILKAANLPQTSPSGNKGRLNFGHRGQASGFTPIITLGDSNWGKTWAAANHRPHADANDLDLGYEGNIDTFYSRAQSEIRDYIGKLPDGKPQEKLTAAAKTFNVPVTINGNLTVTGKCAGCGGDFGSSGPASGGGGPRWSVSLVGQKTAIAPTNLCASSACGPGQYRISYYLDSATACASPGNAAATLTIGWKDETSARTLRLTLAGEGISGGSSLSLGVASNFGGGSISLWSAGNAPLTYSTTYAACATGVGSYSVRITVEKVQ
jgi:hypothetical protein